MPKLPDSKKIKLSGAKEESLINHVRQYPVLYTIQHERYYDTKLKAGIWQTIAGLLEEEKNIVQSSWDSIKAKYKREKKKVAEAARVKDLYEPNWNHYSSLQFLEEAYLPTTTTSSLDSLFEDKVNTVGTMDKATVDKPTLDLIQWILSTVSSTRPNSSGNQPSPRATANNEDLVFLNSLLDHVSKVPDGKKSAMRNEIQDTIMKCAYAKPVEAECCCGGLNFSQMSQRHTATPHTASTPLHNTQQHIGTIKKERPSKKVKVELNYDSDDSDCEYVGHAVPVKKIIPRESKKKSSKKQGQELPAAAPPLMQMDSPQLLQLMLQQQQQYQMLQNLFNLGTRSTAPSTTALPPTDLPGDETSSEPKTTSQGNGAAKGT